MYHEISTCSSLGVLEIRMILKTKSTRPIHTHKHKHMHRLSSGSPPPGSTGPTHLGICLILLSITASQANALCQVCSGLRARIRGSTLDIDLRKTKVDLIHPGNRHDVEVGGHRNHDPPSPLRTTTLWDAEVARNRRLGNVSQLSDKEELVARVRYKRWPHRLMSRSGEHTSPAS